MHFLEQFKSMSPSQALKMAGVALVGLVLLAIIFQLLGSSFRSISQSIPGIAGIPGIPTMSSGMGGGYGGVEYDGYAKYGASEDAVMAELSVRNVAGSISMPYPPSYQTTGDDAEEYEVTQYSARIETRRLEDSCAEVSALKKRDDVIFESANTYDRGCDFTFKVRHESVEEVLALIEAMDPKDLSENTYTIKQQIEDFTSEVDVLEKKRASIDATLASALSAYDEITRLATNTQNAEALAKIIDSRIGIIERLTQERININEQLDRLARAKAEQLDRLEYTYFSVSVYEDKFVDGEDLADSWKTAIKDFVRGVNQILQDLTVGLILLIFFIAQWALYALILLFVAKYGWKIGKNIWNR